MTQVAKKDQPDLFHGQAISDLSAYREDVDLMSHPFFSLEKGRTEPMILDAEIRTAGSNTPVRTFAKITGADYGIASVWDNDVMIYLRTLVAYAMNRGEPVSRRMRFHVHDLLKATRRGTGKASYDGLRAALMRLQATSIVTNVSADGWQKDRGASWIDSFEFITRTTASGKVVMAACEVVVSEWAFAMMSRANRMLAIDQAYFDITGGLERRLYGIIRKHLGQQPAFHIGLERLRELCGSTREMRKFRYDIRKIVDRQSIPGFTLELTNDHRPPAIAAASGTSVRVLKREYLVARPTIAILHR